jgi:gamma-glutamyl-gamma-aminobutyrate hydrolase PuuD
MKLMSAYYHGSYPFDNPTLFPMFTEGESTTDPDDLDKDCALVVWGGGDIFSGYYNRGCSKRGGGYRETERDAIEWALMRRAIELGIPIIGICRGGQMLTAAAGGYLIQHIEGHSGHHSVVSPTNPDICFNVNSIHHQMMVPDGTAHQVLVQAAPRRSSIYLDVDTNVEMEIEPEYIFYPDIRGFAIQWHPEMMAVSSKATHYVSDTFKELM